MRKLLKARQAADILNMPLASVYEMTRRGILPHARLSERMIRYDEERLQSWLAKRFQDGDESEVQASDAN